MCGGCGCGGFMMSILVKWEMMVRYVKITCYLHWISWEHPVWQGSYDTSPRFKSNWRLLSYIDKSSTPDAIKLKLLAALTKWDENMLCGKVDCSLRWGSRGVPGLSEICQNIGLCTMLDRSPLDKSLLSVTWYCSSRSWHIVRAPWRGGKRKSEGTRCSCV